MDMLIYYMIGNVVVFVGGIVVVFLVEVWGWCVLLFVSYMFIVVVIVFIYVMYVLFGMVFGYCLI